MDHTQRIGCRKAVVDAKVSAADAARGVFLIHTGNGKSKSGANSSERSGPYRSTLE